MQNTSLKQKLSLFIFGLFLTAILLEVGLRVAGAVVLFLQERHNHISFNQNEYRILCLGESTTALGGEDSYPSQLEQMLNARAGVRKFSVINKGVVSTTSNDILAHLDQNLDMYKPQLVIVMMGINDRAFLHDLHKSLWWENVKSHLEYLRIYKLAHLLYEHITHRIKEINANGPLVNLSHVDGENYQEVENFLKLVLANSIEHFAQHKSASDLYQKNGQLARAQQEMQTARQYIDEAGLACVELARRYRLQGSLQEAQELLEKAAVFNPNDPLLYQEWGELYLAQKKSAEAIKAFQTALTLDPKNSDVLLGLAHAYHQEHSDTAFLFYDGYLQTKPQDYWGYIELGQWLGEDKHYGQAEGYLNHAIKLRPYFDDAYVDLGQILDDQGLYQKEELFYLKEISLRPDSARLNQALGQFYQSQGRADLAQGYFQKAAASQMPEYSPATLVNYSLLLDKILNRHTKVMVMQYPLRDAAILKNYLGQRKNVVFVENKQNFKQALTRGGYNRYFSDNFAYDFGHCTRAGDELIARHLMEIILKKY
jgi:tetratricopeptide (TPR) repeat protein